MYTSYDHILAAFYTLCRMYKTVLETDTHCKPN